MSVRHFNQRISAATAVRWQRLLERREAGMVSAEYAVGILAAIAFAMLLFGLLKSTTVRELLLGVIKKAFQIG
ncbi:MAG TPA: DUF4244 domain-containing protein [Actinomycetales bacterium]|nr:DUF4244 domain-containing protein [Actinomycetales bacterium]